MDFRAAKIVLAVFLFIAFAMPFARVSRPDESDGVRNALYSAPVTTPPSMAFTRLTALPDSTSRHVVILDLTGK